MILIRHVFLISLAACSADRPSLNLAYESPADDATSFKCTTSLEKTRDWLNTDRFIETRREVFKVKEEELVPSFSIDSLSKTKSLLLGLRNIRDDELILLCPLKNLEILYLNNDGSPNSLTGKTLHHLSSLQKLKFLDLDANKIPASEIWRLKGLSNLEELRLYLNPIGENGYENFLALKSLKILLLQAVGLSMKSQPSFSRLSAHETLEDLYVGDNELSDEFLKVFVNFKHLKKLGFANNSLKGTGLKNLSALENLTSISIGVLSYPDFTKVDPTFDIASLDLLKSLPNLSVLGLRGVKIDEASFISGFKNLKDLKELYLFENLQLTNEELRVFLDYKNLKVLRLNDAVKVKCEKSIIQIRAKFPGIKI